MESYNFKEEAWKRFEAKVCRRCGMNAEAEKLEAEAEAMLQAYIAMLNKRAGIE